MVPMVSSCLLYTLNHCEELVFFEFELLFTINAILILASWVGGWVVRWDLFLGHCAAAGCRTR